MEEAALKYVHAESGEKYTLKYSVFEDPLWDEEGNPFTGYGIRVEEYSGEHLIESAEFPNITVKPIEIQRLFMLLSDSTVTPTTLGDVLEDYLADAYLG